MAGLELTKLDPSNRRPRVPLEDIPQSIIDTVEEAYADADGDVNSRYETPVLGGKDDAEDWLHMARSYGYHRKDTKGRLVIAGNPNAKGTARFRVYDFTE